MADPFARRVDETVCYTFRMKIEFLYGIAMALATSIWILVEGFVASTLQRPDLGVLTGFLAAIIPIAGLTLALRARKKELNGSLTLKDALKTGFVIALIAGIIQALFIFVYLSSEPKAIQSYFELAEQSLREAGENEEIIAESMAQLREGYSPNVQAFSFLVMTILTGTVLSYVIFWFMKRQDIKKQQQSLDRTL